MSASGLCLALVLLTLYEGCSTNPEGTVSTPPDNDDVFADCVKLYGEKKSSKCSVSLLQRSIDEKSRHFNEVQTSPDYLQPKPRLTDGLTTPFLPLSIGVKGKAVISSEGIDGVQSVVDLSMKIAKEMEDANRIIGSNTLTSFNILVEMMKLLSDKQISQATNLLYKEMTPTTDQISYRAWNVFRDAVIQAGTGPSIINLIHWVRDGNVTGEEAAQLVSTLTNTAQYPTEDFMKAFFELVRMAEKMNEPYLNSSSVLAFTSLIKKVYVCNKSMRLRYPVDSFGKPVPRKSKALKFVYLPYLMNKLRHAFEEGDSHKIQVYTRAVGNTAHPKILQMFQPYLEGKEKISNFQRLLMVTCLDSMAIVKPNLVRPVLYSIYGNFAEAPEIRSAAVFLLMRTNPTAQMLENMAQATNFDVSSQVNSAVKSAILSSAHATSDSELSKNARAAVDLLTKKEYGLYYSKNYLSLFKLTEDNLSYNLNWNHIQSGNSILPNSYFFTLRPDVGGFIQRAYKYSWMTSSFDDFTNLLFDQISHGSLNNSETGSGSTWTAGNIAKMLDMQPEVADQVEGNMYITLQGARRFITFDNHTLEELPRLIKFASSAFRIGENFNYTKMYNQLTLRTAFPTAMGLPFVYSMDIPTLMSFVGDLRMNSYPDLANGSPETVKLPQSLNFTSDFKALYSSKVDAKLGFVTPFDNQHYLAGYDSNIQVYIPLRVKVDIDYDNNKIWTKLQPLNPTKHQKIIEYSTKAYTTKHDILHLSPPQLDNNAEITHIRPVKTLEMSRGHHMTGFSFDMKAETEQHHLDFVHLWNSLKNHDVLSALTFYDKKRFIEPYSNFTLCFNGQKSSARLAKFVINYGDVEEYEESEEGDTPLSNAAIPTVGIYEHKKRVEQLLKRSGTGMRDSYAQAVDVSMEFEGETNGVLVLTGAYARSTVSEKARYLFFYAKEPMMKSQNSKVEMAVDVSASIPNVPLANFKEAVDSEATSSIIARINFEDKELSGGEILVKGDMEKSPARGEYLKSRPVADQCLREMEDGNNFLRSCQNVTTRANYMDHYYFRVDYQNITEEWKKTAYQLYSLFRHLARNHVTESIFDEPNTNGRIEFDLTFSPELSSFNASLITPQANSEFFNVRMNRNLKAILVAHPHYGMLDRLSERISKGKIPRCVVDKTSALTFDNKEYPVQIGQCWHAVLQSYFKRQPMSANETKESYPTNDFSFLIRDTEGGAREVMLLLGDDVIKFEPSQKYFTVNEQKYEVSKEKLGHYEDVNGNTLVYAYELPSALRVICPLHDLDFIYDGLRISLEAPNRYRDRVRGLCGNFDGEKVNEFISPKNCIMNNPWEFAATYSIADGSCEGPAKEMRHLAQNATCYEQAVIIGDVISGSNRPKPSKKKRKG